jgi:hypothetical protein
MIPRLSSLLLGSRSSLENQHGRVFLEVYAALVAFAAMVLKVSAGGAGKAQRSVAAHAELCRYGILTLALGALHRSPLPAGA